MAQNLTVTQKLWRPHLALLLLVFSAFVLPLRSQTPATNARPANPASSASPLRQNLIIRPGPLASGPDPVNSMVASAASFDMDSPVEARAEFEPSVVAVGGQVIYRLEVTALDESLAAPETLPSPAGLALHAGGRGQTYEPTGGMKLRPQTTLIYRGTVTNTGTFTMPEFELSAYGKTIKVPPATLTVVPAGTIASHAPPELFLQLPPGDFYVGQLLRVKLLLPVSPEGNVIGLSQPQIKGEFIFSEPAFMGMSQETVQHAGKVFSAFVQQVMITPLREGAEELIGQAHCYMVRPNPANPNLMQRATTLVDSEPVTLPVKALPASGVLPGFTGAVGSFQMETPVLSAREVKAGEPLTVSVTIRGEGNLGRLTPPPVPRLRDWEGFPPPADTTPSAAIQQRGYVTFNYIFIPQSARLDATPAIPFSYFDPEKKAYVDLSVPAMPVKINPLPAGTANQASPSPENFNPRPEDSAVVAREPNYKGLLPTPGKIAASGKPLQQQIGFMVLQIVPAALLGGWWYRERRRRYWAQHPDLVLKRRARRQLRRQMKCIRRAARARDAAGFIAAATNALREVCAPHSGATPGAMTLADVLRELPASEQAGRAGETVHKLFAASNALRFGGMAGENSELLALQNELEQILDGLKLRL